MNRKQKAIYSGFGLGAGIFVMIAQQLQIRSLQKTVNLIDQTQDKILLAMDAEFQREVDEKFEEITDNYDDI